jgi:hypothetical protein
VLENLTVAELVKKFPDLTESEGVFAVTLKALEPSSGSRSNNQLPRRSDQIQSHVYFFAHGLRLFVFQAASSVLTDRSRGGSGVWGDSGSSGIWRFVGCGSRVPVERSAFFKVPAAREELMLGDGRCNSALSVTHCHE